MTGNPNEIVTQAELKAEWESVQGTTSDIPADNECVKLSDVLGHSADGVNVQTDTYTADSEQVKNADILIRKVQPPTRIQFQYNGGGYSMTPRVKALRIVASAPGFESPMQVIDSERYVSGWYTMNTYSKLLTIKLAEPIGIQWDNPTGAHTTVLIQACNPANGWNDSDLPLTQIARVDYPDKMSFQQGSVPLAEGKDNVIWIRILTK